MTVGWRGGVGVSARACVTGWSGERFGGGARAGIQEAVPNLFCQAYDEKGCQNRISYHDAAIANKHWMDWHAYDHDHASHD